MNLDKFILAGFNVMPKTPAIVNGVEVECVFNQSTHNDTNTLGGFENDNEATIGIKTSSLVSPKTLKGKLVVINDESYRVMSVRYGQIITYLTIISPDKA